MLGLSRREWKIEGGSAAAFLAAAVALVAFGPDTGPVDWLPSVAIVAIFALLSCFEYEVGHGYATPTQLAFIPMLMLAPPGLVPLLVATAYGLAAVTSGRNLTRGVVLGISSSWFSLGPAILLSFAGTSSLSIESATALGAVLVCQIAIDYVNWTLHESITAGVRRLPSLRTAAWLYGFDLMLTPLGIGTAILLRQSLWAIALPLPIIFLLRVVQTERRERFDHALELGVTYRKTALLLGGIVEADDHYTGEHSTDVVTLAEAVAVQLGIGDEGRRELEYAALLHDIGKIKIPKTILHKPGPLDDREWAIMRTHAELGAEMLRGVGGMLSEIAPVVRHHHERWDGDGYPAGLAGEAIPLHSRIVACCDTFSAITTERPYRPARSIGEAIDEIARVSGSQLDPSVVAAMTLVLQHLQSARAA